MLRIVHLDEREWRKQRKRAKLWRRIAQRHLSRIAELQREVEQAWSAYECAHDR